MIKFEDIQKANESIKTTNIKGKEYAEVNQRIKAFRMVYPEGTIKTHIEHLANGVCVIKAEVGYYVCYNNDEIKTFVLLGSGTAYEKENSTFINKTSYIENCETSAVGRALGMAGFGIDTSVASYEEVANAIEQQEQDKLKEELIDEKLITALQNSIEKNLFDVNGTDKEILAKYGYKELKEIKMKDYMNIVNEFRNIKGDEI